MFMCNLYLKKGCWWNILGAGGDVGGTYLELVEMLQHGVGGDVGGIYLELVEMLVEHTWSTWRCWWNILGAGGDGGTYLELVEMLVERTWSWWRCWWNILGVGGDVGGTYIELV